jgi:hypothetical protein
MALKKTAFPVQVLVLKKVNQNILTNKISVVGYFNLLNDFTEERLNNLVFILPNPDPYKH